MTGLQAVGADAVGAVLTRALDGLALRQRYEAADVANVETPGYLAHRVDFEDALRQAAGAGTPEGALASLAGDGGPVVQQSLEPTRLDGNNVNLDEVTLQATEAGLRYQLLTQAMSNRFALVTDVTRSA